MTQQQRPRVLLTGGAGYIGSHTAKSLAAAGFTPVVFDNLSIGDRDAVRWGPFVQGDLADIALLSSVLREFRVEAVIHFAANAYVGESMDNPRKYFHNNVANALGLLGAMLDEGVREIVFSSTCAVYGIPEALPLGEDHRKQPVNPYGESKLFVERALGWYGRAYGLRWACLRYFNAAGADPEGDIGERHDPETHLVPLIIEAALGRRPYVQINGDDYPTPDGTAIRDYTHVVDLASAHVHALNHLLEGRESLALNLGTGRGYSVKEVVREVESVIGRPVPTRVGPRRPGDPPELVADAARARSILGWTPVYSDLRTIVQTDWRWRVASLQHETERGA
jgi:UDP-arabinose 4-epimerase